MRYCGRLIGNKNSFQPFEFGTWLHNRKSMSAIMSRVFDVRGKRKQFDNKMLSENGCHMSLMPIWNSYYDYYGLDSLIPKFTS